MINIISESAFLNIKTKTTSKLRDYICLFFPDKLDCNKVGCPFIYCKYYPLTPYGSIVATNFRRYFKKYGIFVETYQNTILAITSDEFIQLYNKLSIID